jgi:hypothetical protein
MRCRTCPYNADDEEEFVCIFTDDPDMCEYKESSDADDSDGSALEDMYQSFGDWEIDPEMGSH